MLDVLSVIHDLSKLLSLTSVAKIIFLLKFLLIHYNGDLMCLNCIIMHYVSLFKKQWNEAMYSVFYRGLSFHFSFDYQSNESMLFANLEYV